MSFMRKFRYNDYYRIIPMLFCMSVGTSLDWARYMGWPGYLVIIAGGIILTIWNLGTKIDLSDPSTTIFNPVFVPGIIVLCIGILMIQFHK